VTPFTLGFRLFFYFAANKPVVGSLLFRNNKTNQVKAKVGNILSKAATLRINLNVDGAPIASK